MSKVDQAAHSNAQSQPIKYLSKTDVDCRVCNKAKMHVRFEKVNRGKSTITQQLECPNCAEGYPREMDPDKVTVLSDPFMDVEALKPRMR